jgi:hypothetical protein
MPGEKYERGGMFRGISIIFHETREMAAESARAAVRFGQAVERRGSTLPLLRRMSARFGSVGGGGGAEYEAIPLGRPGSGARSPV